MQCEFLSLCVCFHHHLAYSFPLNMKWLFVVRTLWQAAEGKFAAQNEWRWLGLGAKRMPLVGISDTHHNTFCCWTAAKQQPIWYCLPSHKYAFALFVVWIEPHYPFWVTFNTATHFSHGICVCVRVLGCVQLGCCDCEQCIHNLMSCLWASGR